LTGARCDAGLLRVSLPWSEWPGFSDVLTFFGSYHILDYDLFYTNIRVNALERCRGASQRETAGQLSAVGGASPQQLAASDLKGFFSVFYIGMGVWY